MSVAKIVELTATGSSIEEAVERGRRQGGRVPAQHRARLRGRDRGEGRGRQGRQLSRPSEAHVRRRLSLMAAADRRLTDSGHRGQAGLHGATDVAGLELEPPGRVPVHARPVPGHVPRPAVDDPAVRRLRLRGGDERALPLPARAGPDRPVGRLRPADPARLRLRPPARRRRGRALRASRSTRSPTWSCCSTGSRSTRSRPR